MKERLDGGISMEEIDRTLESKEGSFLAASEVPV